MKCAIPQTSMNEPFEDLLDSFNSQSYWVRFFMRPCCPPPGEATARDQIDHLKSDIDSRQDLPKGQRDMLKHIADDRLEWYLKLPVRHTA